MSSQEESNNSDTSSDGSFYELAGLGAVLGAYAGGRYFATPLATHHPPLFPYLSGRQWVELNLHDSAKCYKNFCMKPAAFMQLHQLLVTNYGLQSTRQFDTVEALAMFLWARGTGQSCRQIQDRFERSLDTISRKMGNVADAMFSFAHTIIVPKDPNYTQLHPRLLPYAPYFDGCIGAIDGTHIRARINHDSRLDFINRKGCTTFNVLAIVDMDMRFTYVGMGRAGSCHDMAVLRDCMATANYPHPSPGRYYLVDSGYALDKGYLGPYRSTRYHLEEFRRRGAETMQEKFNYHHASLRNVVERAFGVLKAKWHILREVPLYAREKQTKMIIACCAVHNFLLDRALKLHPQRSMPRNVDYDMSLWVAANATMYMAIVRDWISLGISC
ncbi:hypothetical protein U9M48_034884, partial [Paspalum notatum var. saurae]